MSSRALLILCLLMSSGRIGLRAGSSGLMLGKVFCCLRRVKGGLLVFVLASALRERASRVAPVRGGTYFSLPPQRKVGKRKRLTPPARDLCPRAPNGPTLHTAAPLFVRVASAPNQRLTHSNTRTSASGSEWYVPPRWQTVCRLSRRIARRSYKVG